ncbi:unnamed protein product [Peronospora belbahrii]|uniref:Pru domain-containing protein n=1 Tax=Peronospora belbahrii TaxID=622444 RepID=A0AAU9KUS2_9STRA|nr:unnamed protein product [Peronospora belbahrii]CAH0519920.1 unnamed protein product [Peronospora belbahrii]
MTSSLFPQFGNVFGAPSTAGRNELVSFNAGKMTVKPTSNGKFLITPQLEKGKVCLSRGDDQLLHFQWMDRQTGASPEDFIIFPDDAHFAKVETGRPEDRVYILQYKNSSRRFFFWMQNKDASRDDELVKKVNDSMNNAQTAASSEGGRGAGNNVQLDHNAIMQMLGAMGAGDQGRGGAAGTGQAVQMSELQNILQNMGLPAGTQSVASSPATSAVSSSQASQNGGGSSAAATTASTQHEHDVSGMEVDEMDEDELLRLAIEESMRDGGSTNSNAPGGGTTGDAVAPSATAVAPVPTPSTPVAQPTASVAAPTIASAPATGGALTTADLQRAMASFQQLAQPKPVSLTKLLSADNVERFLDDQACVETLLPHLPEGSQTPAELRATLRSPQLRQSIGSLERALQTGNLNAVMANFGLDPAAGAAKLAFGDGVGALLAAIQAWVDQQDTTMPSSNDKSEADN